MNIKNIFIIVFIVVAYAYVSNQDYQDYELAHQSAKQIK